MPEKHGWRFLPKKNRWIYIVVLIIAIGAGVYFWPRPKASIETEKIKRGDIVESISSTGTVDTQTLVKLQFQIGGKLVYLGAKKGDMVKKGQTIGVLDQRTVQKNLESSLRDFSQQRYAFDKTLSDNQNRTPENALSYDMQKILRDNQYNLEKAITSVELQDLAKQQTILTSPIDGILLLSDAQTTGINVTPSWNFAVADAEHLIFKIDVDEADIGKVKVGQIVKIRLDAYQDDELDLPVRSIDFSAHTNSTGGNIYTVEVDLPLNNNFEYRIGMNGDAEIVTNEAKNVLSVPLSGIDDDGNVYVKFADGYKKIKVKTGLSNDTDAEVVSGLVGGEEVALDAADGEKQVVK